MILERSDGSELVLEGLEQAVFPLLKFFWFKLGCREPAAGEPRTATDPPGGTVLVRIKA